ncbi:MAG: antitoxin (DNA-binding transcriptional repressor) of toxin-antitoxin stability system [Cyclobacteriaceae bacterium]|jgi:antitoxin (DNA-binding transcriptional repressor) of toxin-antitoxin stability system
MKIYNIGFAKSKLSALIEMAMEGKEVIIGKRNKPLIRLLPMNNPKLEERKGGHLKGKIWIATDFDQQNEQIIANFEESAE